MTLKLGVDIGGSAIKAALVDVATGQCVGNRLSVATPRPATPDALASVVGQLSRKAGSPNDIGVGFPGVIRNGVAKSAAHLEAHWLEVDVADCVRTATGAQRVTVLNDADAAGVAEARLGAGRDEHGTLIVVTLGTGIGTALFHQGVLVPNSELGHLVINGSEAETVASARVKNQPELTWESWGRGLDLFLEELERLMWPDLFVIGGGISADFEHFCDQIETRTPVVPAQLGNDAGIIGAAIWSPEAPESST